jgi:hypothetical protein
MPVVMAAAPADQTNLFARESDEPVALSPNGNRVGLDAPGGRSETAAAIAPAQVSFAQIVLEDVSVENDLAVTFDVFLNLPEGGQADPSRLVGSFNFFGAVHEGMSHPKRFVFDITEEVRQAIAEGTWPENPSVTILPRRGFAGQPARIGNVRLIIE